MLYDRSGFRLSTPVRYLKELLNRRQPDAGNMWTFEQLSSLVLHWWDCTSSYHLQSLAMECIAGGSKRAQQVRTRLELAELMDWIAQANTERGIAPSRQDIMTQYAVVKQLDLDDWDSLQTVGRQNIRVSAHKSVWQRFAKSGGLKRGRIAPRPKLCMATVRTQAFPQVSRT